MQIALIVPVFNEENRWNEKYWNDLLKLRNVFWIFVNDGSTDNTIFILEKMNDNDNVKIINLEGNSGKASAIKSGVDWLSINFFRNCKVFGYLDSDGAFSKSDIEYFLKLSEIKIYKENAVNTIWSSRVALSGRNIERKKHRHYLGRAISTFLTFDQSSIPYDTQSGFKLFRFDQTIIELFKEVFTTKWFIDLELLIRSRKFEYHSLVIWEEPLLEWKEVSNSKIKVVNFFDILWEILKVRKLIRSISK